LGSASSMQGFDFLADFFFPMGRLS
jgi:hypothetical protein